MHRHFHIRTRTQREGAAIRLARFGLFKMNWICREALDGTAVFIMTMARDGPRNWNGRQCWRESEEIKAKYNMFRFRSALIGFMKSKSSERVASFEACVHAPPSCWLCLACGRESSKIDTFRSLAAAQLFECEDGNVYWCNSIEELDKKARGTKRPRSSHRELLNCWIVECECEFMRFRMRLFEIEKMNWSALDDRHEQWWERQKPTREI
jgi:hypothetical protein